MKKRNQSYDYSKSEKPSTAVEGSSGVYGLSRKVNISKDFTYYDFKKINSKTDFTRKEWSGILHISERTLQRYAKDNSTFGFGVTDRILQINKVIERGKEVFGSYEKFLLWIRDTPYMLEGRLSFQSLASIEGIHNVLTQLGRIEHGIFA